MKDKQITLVLLPGLNGTEGLFQPLLEVTPEQFTTLIISYPTHEKKSYQELSHLILDKLNSNKPLRNSFLKKGLMGK